MDHYHRNQMHPRQLDFNDESIESRDDETEGRNQKEGKIKNNDDNIE